MSDGYLAFLKPRDSVLTTKIWTSFRRLLGRRGPPWPAFRTTTIRSDSRSQINQRRRAERHSATGAARSRRCPHPALGLLSCRLRDRFPTLRLCRDSRRSPAPHLRELRTRDRRHVHPSEHPCLRVTV